MQEEEKASLKVNIRGIVQGVLFRASTVDKATELGLLGYVRNLSDGSVEVVAEGAKDKLKLLLNYLEQGPPSSVVSEVDVLWGEHSNRYFEFSINR